MEKEDIVDGFSSSVNKIDEDKIDEVLKKEKDVEKKRKGLILQNSLCSLNRSNWRLKCLKIIKRRTTEMFHGKQLLLLQRQFCTF